MEMEVNDRAIWEDRVRNRVILKTEGWMTEIEQLFVSLLSMQYRFNREDQKDILGWLLQCG